MKTLDTLYKEKEQLTRERLDIKEISCHMHDATVNTRRDDMESLQDACNKSGEDLDFIISKLSRIQDLYESLWNDYVETFQPRWKNSPVNGLKVQEDNDAMLIRLYFDEKPDRETLNIIKRHGFRWSSYLCVWQRVLDETGIYAMRSLLYRLETGK